MSSSVIDLSSDTATRPSDAMRHAMASAPVGDEQRGEDPTVNRLQEFAAGMLGKEAALFVPSATMANQIAIHVQTRPGDAVICHETAHILRYEGGGPSALSGVQLTPLRGARGIFTSKDIERAVFPDDPHFPRTRLVCIENTHNSAGGCVWKPEQIADVAHAARDHGLALHLDGSRLMNASAALSLDPALLCAPFDTVTLCLSKGIGAPVGAVIAGSRDFIREAGRRKKLFGGSMRQAGIIAAGGLYGLQRNLARLPEDHENAARLAEGLGQIPGVRLDPAPETNLVFFDVAGTGLTGQQAVQKLDAVGVRASGATYAKDTRLRFVTHLDVSRADIDEAIARCHAALCS